MSDTLTKQRSKKSPVVAHIHHAGHQWVAAKFDKGLVAYYVHGPKDHMAARNFTTFEVIQALQAGLPVKELTALQLNLAMPMDRLAPMLGISKATFHRRKGAGERLGPAESDRVVRFARLLGNQEDARQWLGSPQFGLGGAVPLEYAKTEVGAREVENLLGRIEYGVYS